jgi:hypothetical protein
MESKIPSGALTPEPNTDSYISQLPANGTGLKKIITSDNVIIRYKQRGKEGIYETRPGVNSYPRDTDLDE